MVVDKTQGRVFTTVQFAKKRFGIFLDGPIELFFELYDKSKILQTFYAYVYRRWDTTFVYRFYVFFRPVWKFWRLSTAFTLQISRSTAVDTRKIFYESLVVLKNGSTAKYQTSIT